MESFKAANAERDSYQIQCRCKFHARTIKIRGVIGVIFRGYRLGILCGNRENTCEEWCILANIKGLLQLWWKSNMLL